MADASSTSVPSARSKPSTRKASQRVQLSCEPCKQSKLRCDRSLPICNQCYKRSRESECKYTDKGLRYNVEGQKIGSMKAKIERLEGFVNQLQARQHSTGLHHERPPTSTSDDDADTVDRLGQLKVAEGGSTQWIGPSSWQSVAEDIAEVKAFLEETTDDPYGGARITEGTPVSVNVLLASSVVSSMETLLEHLPSRVELDRYISAWFNAMDPVRIIVHSPTFQEQYQSFWTNTTKAEPAWLALFFAMAAIGAEINGQLFNDRVALDRAVLLRDLTSQALVLASPTKPKRFLIEALILHIIGLLFKHHDVTTYIWQLMGMTIRVCQQAGYHRDPHQIKSLSKFDGEMRRRVWMAAYELDISISNTIGMVSSVNPRICDTALPSNLTDTDFSPNHFGTVRPHQDCTPVLVQAVFSSIVFVLGDIVVASQAVGVPSSREVQDLRHKLESIRSRLPEKLKMVPLDQCLMDAPSDTLDRLRIDFAYQKSLCLLYQRYLKSSGHEEERRNCLGAAETIIRNCVAMLEAGEPGGQLSSLKILMVRHVHETTLAGMLLCSEIKRQAIATPGSVTISLPPDLSQIILRVCELWDFPQLQSRTAKLALRIIRRFLGGNEAMSGNSSSTPSDTDGTVPDLSWLAASSHGLTSTTNSLDPLANTSYDPSDVLPQQGGAMFEYYIGQDEPLMGWNNDWPLIPPLVPAEMMKSRQEGTQKELSDRLL